MKVVNGKPTVLTISDRNYYPDYYDLLLGINEGGYSLRIKTVTLKHDNGQFFCGLLDVSSKVELVARPAIVVVLVRPDPPEIIGDLPTVFNEGNVLKTSCQSKNGSPPPSFEWTYSNNSKVSSEWQVDKNASNPKHASISQLKLFLSAADNGIYLKCKIWNRAIGHGGAWLETETRIINVEYRPRVSVGPVEYYSVEVGQSIRLTCRADANPDPAKFIWEHPVGYEKWTKRDKKFVATREHAGEYKCLVVNSVGSGSALLTVDVQYAPVVKVHTVISPNEGNDVVLQCDVDANPAADSVAWTGPGLSSNNPSSRLELLSVTRQSAGVYTCIAKNTLSLHDSGSVPRTGQGQTVVNVRHRPGSASIRIASELPIVVGGSVSLECSSDDPGNPPAQFRWDIPGKQFNANDSKEVHSIANVKLTDAGQYTCMAWNELGQGRSASLTLQVIEPARLSRLLALDKLVNTGRRDMQLQCKATGHPAPNITWFKGGHPLVDDGRRWLVESVVDRTECDRQEWCSFLVTGRCWLLSAHLPDDICSFASLVWLDEISWLDKGQYSCQAYNGAGDPHRSDTVLQVVHSPVVLNDGYPDEALAAVDIGTKFPAISSIFCHLLPLFSFLAMLSCLVSSRPSPTFRWYRDSVEIQPDSGRLRIRPGTAGNVSNDEFESVLEIHHSNEEDLGRYMCRIVNGQGGPTELIVSLQRRSGPNRPSLLRLFDSSHNWLLIGWYPGFDGGQQQQFLMDVRQMSPWTGKNGEKTTQFQLSMDSLETWKVSGNRRWKRSYTHGVAIRSFLLYNMTGLSPLNWYRVRVRASNSFGSSEWTSFLQTSTQDMPTNESMVKPGNVHYSTADQLLTFQPTIPPNNCLMIYVQMDHEPLYSVKCVESGTSAKVTKADKMMVRFCTRGLEFRCSEGQPVVVEIGLSSVPWSILVPSFLVLLSILIVVCVVAFCCHLRSSDPESEKRSNKRSDYETDTNQRTRPKVSNPYTTDTVDNKNLPVHGSQADSGVFTLGSQFNGGHQLQQQQQQQQQSFNPNGTIDRNENGFINVGLRTSFEDGVDRWGSAADPYDLYNGHPPYNVDLNDGGYFDPYGPHPQGLVELNPQGNGAEFDDDASSFSTPNSRRVMREIIV